MTPWLNCQYYYMSVDLPGAAGADPPSFLPPPPPPAGAGAAPPPALAAGPANPAF